jgi:hypothetical protein
VKNSFKGYDESIIEVLQEDTMEAVRACHRDKTVTARRSAVRALFASLEAMAWTLKATVVRASVDTPHLLNELERLAFTDETYVVDPNGRVRAKANFIPLTTSIKMIVRTLSRGAILQPISLDSLNMQGLDDSLQLRHRLTHPRCAADLDVTPDDVDRTITVWEQVIRLLSAGFVEVRARYAAANGGDRLVLGAASEALLKEEG